MTTLVLASQFHRRAFCVCPDLVAHNKKNNTSPPLFADLLDYKSDCNAFSVGWVGVSWPAPVVCPHNRQRESAEHVTYLGEVGVRTIQRWWWLR